MQKKIIEFNKAIRGDAKLDYQAGDVVKVYRKIKEGEKERIQLFEGIIIAVKGRQSSSPTITVRKVTDGIGVEIVLPILSPNIEKIELVKKAKVRRSKLYYLRNLTVKKSRLKYKGLAEFVVEEPKTEEIKEEAPVEEKTPASTREDATSTRLDSARQARGGEAKKEEKK
jgi:large subunit ribosomal protein L19